MVVNVVSGPVLVALHQFLETFPASYSKTMADDTPIRTIKTVIHTLVQELGENLGWFSSAATI